MNSIKLFRWFRRVAVAEGISFLVLLLIAMPLKYLAGLAWTVMIAGTVHGILFIDFILLAWLVRKKWHKTNAWFAKAILASLLPFGTLILDNTLKKEEAALQRQ